MNKIKIISALIFVLSVILALYSKHIAEENDASLTLLKAINEQKAFTQEISKNIFYIYNNKHASTQQLDASIKSFVANVNKKEEILEDLDNADIRDQIQKIIVLWNRFYLLVQKFRDVSQVHNGYTNIILQKLVNQIYNANLDLIVAFDRLITMHKQYFDKSKKKNRIIQITLFVTLLLLLVYLFTQLKGLLGFIQKFLKTSKSIIKKSTVKGVQPIETEGNVQDVSEAANDFNFLVQNINESITYAEKSIQGSVDALEDVEEKIENLIELIAAMQTSENIDKELLKKEDVLIETLDELSLSSNKLKSLKKDISSLI